MDHRIIDLSPDSMNLVEQTAVLLRDAFHNRTEDWQDLESARQEVMESLAPERISRVAVEPSGTVLGWVGGIPMYRGRVWELHPLVVAKSHRRQGIGRALVHDLERVVSGRGALTLWLGSDDENNETSLSRVDLYADVPGAIRVLGRSEASIPVSSIFVLAFASAGSCRMRMVAGSLTFFSRNGSGRAAREPRRCSSRAA